LIRRIKGKLVITTFGKIVFNSQKVVEDANNCQWMLKVLDSIDAYEDISQEEHGKLLDDLIDNKHIKEILSKRP
jgi:hypothetical protein